MPAITLANFRSVGADVHGGAVWLVNAALAVVHPAGQLCATLAVRLPFLVGLSLVTALDGICSIIVLVDLCDVIAVVSCFISLEVTSLAVPYFADVRPGFRDDVRAFVAWIIAFI